MLPKDAIHQPGIKCIDMHHHYFPDSLKKDRPNPNLNWKTPPENLPWTPEKSLQAMSDMGVDFTVLSFPAISDWKPTVHFRGLARSQNDWIASVCQTYPSKFGFFGVLPSLLDIEGALDEVAHVLDDLGANGISLSSCYGQDPSTSLWVGDGMFAPIWEELNRRQAVVFLHGSQIPASIPSPDASLGVPITEVPNQTFKAASHLVVTGQRKKYPNVKIILAHGGGAIPMLASRVAVLSSYMGCGLSPEEILDGFKTFWYDVALSGDEPSLRALEAFVGTEKMLFGTDYPAVATGMANWFNKHIKQYYQHNLTATDSIFKTNATRLFSTDSDIADKYNSVDINGKM